MLPHPQQETLDTAVEGKQSLCFSNCKELAFQAFKESAPLHSKLLEGQSLHYQFNAKSH